MSTKHTYQLRALRNHFELACIFGAIVIVTDIGWVIHDIMVNGLSIAYILIFSFLLSGLIGTLYVIWVHNCTVAKQLRKSALEMKLYLLKKKNHHLKRINHE